MTSPNANEMPSRSAPVTAGVLSPARTRVATTDPGPTSTSRAVPSDSANARWERECSSTMTLLREMCAFDNVECDFDRNLLRTRGLCQAKRASALDADQPHDPDATGERAAPRALAVRQLLGVEQQRRQPA